MRLVDTIRQMRGDIAAHPVVRRAHARGRVLMTRILALADRRRRTVAGTGAVTAASAISAVHSAADFKRSVGRRQWRISG